MAIDTTLFGADLPAGTYTKGQIIPLGVVSGPMNVRPGRGTPRLKRMIGGIITAASGSTSHWRIHIKNDGWIDESIILAGYLTDSVALDQHSGCVKFGNNDALIQNSSWEVYAECIDTSVTTTVANSLFMLVDIDYDAVSSIINPDKIDGVPMSINYDKLSTPVNAFGSITTSTWSIENVDYFKAGNEYALQEVTAFATAAAQAGFFAISGAASMGGLTRIIPISVANMTTIKQQIEYATKLVKGPMNIQTMLFGPSATTTDLFMIHEYVKRRIA